MAIDDEFHFPDLKAAADRLADDLARVLKAAIVARGHATIAVSGGRTPELVLPKLAAADLDWPRVHVTLADERRVHVDDAESNEGLARRLLLTGAARAARFTGLMDANTKDSIAALHWPLDATFLGLGPDGHIASLFPGGDWCDAPGRTLTVAATADRLARISLTPDALLDCRHIFLIMSGAEKRAVFEAAKTPGSELELPVRLILHQDRVPVTVYTAP